MCVVDVRVYLRSSVGILDEALDLTADLCMALFLHVTLAKVLLFKAAPFFAKKVTAAISFSGP